METHDSVEVEISTQSRKAHRVGSPQRGSPQDLLLTRLPAVGSAAYALHVRIQMLLTNTVGSVSPSMCSHSARATTWSYKKGF